MASIRRRITIEGMHCVNCEKRVIGILAAGRGVTDAKVNWKTGRGTLTYEPGRTDMSGVARELDDIGYLFSFDDPRDGDRAPEKKGGSSRVIGVVFALLGLLVVGYLILKISSAVTIPDITPTMGLGLLFLVGLLTGFHCVGMCGGFVVGYTTKAAAEGVSTAVSHLQYGAGKLLSYTAMGAAFGLFGSLVTFTPLMRGVVGIGAGIFLLIYGLSMLKIFSWTKRIRIASPKFLDRFIDRESDSTRAPLSSGS